MTAPGLTCEFCNGAHPVNWLITHLSPAATLSACDEDFPMAIIPIVAGELGVDPGGLYDVISGYVNTQAQAEAETAKVKPAKPKTAQGRPRKPAGTATTKPGKTSPETRQDEVAEQPELDFNPGPEAGNDDGMSDYRPVPSWEQGQ